MLDLQARIRFEESKPRLVAGIVCVEQELESAEAAVVHCLGQAYRRRRDARTEHRRQPRTGRDFDQLLVAPLQRAFALTQLRDATGAVADDLHLDMPRATDQPLDIHVAVAERGACFGLAACVGLVNLAGVMHCTHAAAAAAGDGLDHHRAALAKLVQKSVRLL